MAPVVAKSGWTEDFGKYRIYSSTGFMYNATYVAISGMWDALAYMHNGVMGLPPL